MIALQRFPAAALAAVLFISPLARATAQESAPAEPAVEPVADSPANEAPAASEASVEFKALFERIVTKLKAGEGTEEAFATEVAEFDALIEKYAEKAPEDAFMISFMKARFYLEVLQNETKGLEIFKAMKTRFANLDDAARLDEVIQNIEAKIEATARLGVGRTFPAFAESDLDGKPLSLEAYRGKVVLVDFWATWCGPCVAELPNVVAAYEKYHDKGFEIIGISLDKDRDKLTEFIAKEKMPWAQYFDGLGWENKLARAYGIDGIPATFLLDREGRIVARDLRGAALEEKLAELIQ